MKYRLKLILLLIMFATFVTKSYTATSTSERRITKPIDIMAMGGAGVASYGRFGMIYMNPASAAVKGYKAFSILKVGASVNWDLYNLYMQTKDFIDDSATNLSLLSDDAWEAILNIRSTIGVNGPITLGYVGNGLALLLYNDIETSVIVHQSPGLPYVDFGTYVDVGFLVNYGFELPMPFFLGKYTKVYMGLSLNYLNRLKHEDSRMSLIEAFDLGMGILNFQKGLQWGQNIGSDIGILIKMPRLSIGVVVRNWFSTGFSWVEYGYNPTSGAIEKIEGAAEIPRTYFDIALDVGVGYRIKTASIILSQIDLYLDVANSIDFSENYFLKLRMGGEITLLKIIKIRGGLHQGYPTFGLGFEIPVIKINLSYFTEEMGNWPGSIPQEKLMVDIHFMI